MTGERNGVYGSSGETEVTTAVTSTGDELQHPTELGGSSAPRRAAVETHALGRRKFASLLPRRA